MPSNTNVLAAGIEIVGSIYFQNDMHIDGKVDGNIQSDSGKVTIGEQANIKGDINAGVVHVYGHVVGKVTSERCHLSKDSVVTGDIKTGVLSMDEGARLSGLAEIG
ncbi:MAG: polymer-forming cytoskeletal protein [Akkermansiaceae bacterium]|nr:polymer-forming cytoskeletal protein [Akkermansiaceae bacterium]